MLKNIVLLHFLEVDLTLQRFQVYIIAKVLKSQANKKLF